MRNLRSVDLNLLVTLEALLTECNVTRAAQRLNLSQPSVSVRLAKLRQLFGDPLLLPRTNGMLPTSRGAELLGPLRTALAGMEQLLNEGEQFDPARAEHVWHVACTDYSEYTVLLPLIARLQRSAPHARVACHHVAPNRLEKQIEAGTITVGLIDTASAPTSLRGRSLYRESYKMAVRVGHPALRGRMTVRRFCDLKHVIVSPEGGGFFGFTDIALEAIGHRRNVVVSAATFLCAVELVRQSELVAILPSRLLQGRTDGLAILEPPIPVSGFDMSLVWHERTHREPAQRWLRDQIVAAAVSPASSA